MAERVEERPVGPISIVRRAIYATLLPIPIVCFIGTLLTDLAYKYSGGNLLWVNFSSLPIEAGLLFGALAGIALLIEAIRFRGWGQFGLLLAAWIIIANDVGNTIWRVTYGGRERP